ncbi:MAG TPA: ribonuclease P protein component [Gemmatimonadaceae bacterium]|nr:ribonuclease P protein component [Gemmatimonadaceae bacterium]
MKFSAAAARRAASASPLSSRASTQAHNDGFGFPRRNRLTRGTELQTVIREGKRIRTVHLDVRVLASPLGTPRVGIVVPLHRHSAVERNRLKRRLRELVRTELLPVMRALPNASDVAFRARREAYDADIHTLRADVLTVSSRLSAGTTAS